MDNATQLWYEQLSKPSWAPPTYLFGIVWPILYAIIIVSFGYVFWKWWNGEVTTAVMIPFVVNIVANLIFTPLQFGLRSNELATLDIFVVLASLGYGLWSVYPIIPWVSLVNIPYLLWVSFATVLQCTITYLNW